MDIRSLAEPLVESVTGSLDRNVHTSGQLEVILKGFGSSPVPPCTKDKKAILTVGCYPLKAPPYWLISRYLLHTLDTVLGDTADLLTMVCMHMPRWSSFTA